MSDANYFAEKAACCRTLAAQASEPNIAEQLLLWAKEFDAMARAFGSHLAAPAGFAEVPTDPEQPIIRPKSNGVA